MDLLSNVLAVTRMGNSLIGSADFEAPWGIDIDPMNEVAVHVVMRGSCYVQLEGEAKNTLLADGDVVLVSSGTGHALKDTPHTPCRPYQELLTDNKSTCQTLREDATGPITSIFCAKYRFDHRGPHPLISLLPKLIHLPVVDAQRFTELMLLVQLLKMESCNRNSGRELVIPRMVDTLLVFIVRAWLDKQPIGAGGWFGALRDPCIAKALSLMHEKPENHWTVENLAQAVNQSRPTFNRRFSALVGEPPATYLTRWRMCLAAKTLRETPYSLEKVGESVGYETAAALSKAFRKHFSVSPGQYRNQYMQTSLATANEGVKA